MNAYKLIAQLRDIDRRRPPEERRRGRRPDDTLRGLDAVGDRLRRRLDPDGLRDRRLEPPAGDDDLERDRLRVRTIINKLVLGFVTL